MQRAESPRQDTKKIRLWKGLTLLLELLAVAALLEFASHQLWSIDSFRERIAASGTAGWRLQWLDRDRDPAGVAYSFDDHHSRRGWALRPGLRNADVWGPDSLSSTASGFRGVREPDPARHVGGVRIVTIGDSFTFGEEVRDAETYSAELERRIPDAEVVNLGVHGYGHGQMLLYLQETAERLQPDLVIVGFIDDDMSRTLLGFRDYAKPRFVMRGERLVLAGIPVPSPAELEARWWQRSRFVTLVSLAGDLALERSGIRTRDRERVTSALLDRMVEVAYKAGAVTVFAYLPHDADLAVADTLGAGRRFLREYCDDRAALCIDLTPRFRRAVAADPTIKRVGHWDAAGHDLVADGLVDFLEERRLLERIRPAAGKGREI